MSAKTVELFIGGAWRPGAAGTAPVVDPASEAETARVALAGEADVDAAVAAAAASWRDYAAMPARERGRVLVRAADLVRERIKTLAARLTAEQGKTLAESHAELERAADTLAWNGEEAGRLSGTTLPGWAPGSTRVVEPRPLGVVAAITAWNFPAVLVARKLGAALAAGCTVVLKAAEEAPMTAAGLVRCLADAGLPSGAANLVFGDPPMVARRLIGAPDVAAVTFTGSARVGREIAALAAAGLKPCVLELGGHAPVIVCADADIERALGLTLPAKFASAGQSCVAPSRFYVHGSHYDQFVDRFAEAARAVAVGDGRDPATRMGPLANARRLAAMDRLVTDATARGARLVQGGSRLGNRGFFFAPTVLADVPEDAHVMNEEPFGPIAPIASFEEVDEVLARANRLPFAFAAYVFTDTASIAARLAGGLSAGNIGVNQMAPSLPDAPIGGRRDSGVGYEGGRRGLEAFVHHTLVSTTR
jgi:succinate-semialdehyde dehydrogenase/glutarate-semialdehyde dehydrogenase